MSKKKGLGRVVAASVIATGIVAGTVAAGVILPQTNYVNISCYGNNGTPVFEQRVRKGSTASLPELERDGFNFDGWYLDDSLNTEITSSTKFTKNTSVYAGWELTAEALADDPTTLTETVGITKIGAGAFKGCTGLTSITIPETITSIASTAFEGCSNLKTVYFNATNCNDFSAAQSPFANLASKVVFGENVERVPAYIFGGATALTNVQFLGNKITSIGKNAFSSCTQITNMVIPSSVTSIEQSAFEGCTGLANVTLSSNLTTIANSAFCSCTALTAITIPNKVKDIGQAAFSACNNLSSLTLGTAVSNIDVNAFSGCKITDLTIPSSVKTIKDNAFNGCTIKYLTTGGSETSVSSSAFDSTELYQLTLRGSAVAYNNVLGSKTGPLNMVTYNYDNPTSSGITAACITNARFLTIGNNVTTIPASAFSNHTAPESVSLGSSVTNIGASAFAGKITNQTSLTLPSSLQTIGEYAFSGGCQATTLTIPSSVTSIGLGAFNDFKKLTRLNFYARCNGDYGAGGAIFKNAGISGSGLNINWGSGTVSSPGYLFYESGANLVPELTIPNNVTLGVCDFSGVASLQKVSVGSGGIVGNAFSGCTGLKELVLREGVTSSGYFTFSRCTALTTITFPKTYIGEGYRAFSGCTALTSIILPNSTTGLGPGEFAGCTNLKNVYIPSSVTDMSSATSYGEAPFLNCSSSLNIFCGASTKPSNWGTYWNNYASSSKFSNVYWGVGTFADTSWSNIKAVSEAGIADKLWHIRDTKALDLTDGTRVEVIIADFNHDYVYGSNSKNGITIITSQLLPSSYDHILATESEAKEGYWHSSMNTYLNNTLYNSLPYELRTSIATTGKGYYDNKVGFLGYDAKLWLLSSTELGFERSGLSSEQTDGYAYPCFEPTYYRDLTYSDTGERSSYWLRSEEGLDYGWYTQYSMYYNSFYYLPSTGILAICFGFCI